MRTAADRRSERRLAVTMTVAGFGCLLAGGLLGLLTEVAFFGPYLVGLSFWAQVSGGCLALTLIRGVAGGRWGELFSVELAAARWTWPALLVLALPLLYRAQSVYGLNQEEAVWWAARGAAYLCALAALAWMAGKRPRERWSGSGPGLVVLGLVFSLISVEWMMALTPHFHSTIFPFIWFSDSMVGALALLAAVRGGGDPPGCEAGRYQFGKLLFAAVFFWGYIAISQWVIVWSADLPHEARWYLDRTEDGWIWGTWAVAALRFGLPFAWLLSAPVKRSPRRSARVGVLLLGSQWVASSWLVLPSLGGGIWELGLAALFTAGMGGLWSCAWLFGRNATQRREGGVI